MRFNAIATCNGFFPSEKSSKARDEVEAVSSRPALFKTALIVFGLTPSLPYDLPIKKDVWCHNEYHTQNFCDGYHLGAADCENPTSDKYRGNEKGHTKNWRDGYNLGWTKGGGDCVIP